ncbi:helix-turn-helix transcriptional regulator [Paenibacillus alvei]|uniref:Helix-turn-helix transcriptional regulator n=1 Tax=Paenibacillus alvei TaxID=44250 RepID=A0ABT4GX54_PAEAL|nr:helix-turn-helix transcriptional regulator [Paenibacillus alvei]MCY9540708.1 helix-turn-helix transcriptional regulator [Paenibacillus alvei]MCY9703029.1 helix-turn-helix transcriptional regulator [Paenibacillus alvei]MCY9734610.1 helix-turn-helix transcriptional regulator [Paenibacillus alvei]MCY9755372.1 helix-turn-helix transcriptional regulator [Paenibacillus alvei]MCY9761264.1 helix-turn-helix transcriptional regulator [Paenibacillus alvei]
MLILKIEEIMKEKNLNTSKLSEMTGIRWNTVNDMVKNTAKHWVPENLEKIMDALDIKNISELIERVNDEELRE